MADEICPALTVHATVEEEIFYPAVRNGVKEGEDMIDEATVEHASAKDLITQILGMNAEDDLFDAKGKFLSELIDHHVGAEEEKMFVKVRKASLDLLALGEEIATRKTQLLTSPSGPTGINRAVGRRINLRDRQWRENRNDLSALVRETPIRTKFDVH